MELNENVSTEQVEPSNEVQQAEAVESTTPPIDQEAVSNETEDVATGDDQSGEGETDLVEDEHGNKYYPAGKLDKIVSERLSKMAEQKNAAVQNTLEAIRTDPEFRKLALEAAGVTPEATEGQANGSQQPNAFDEFLRANVQPEHHAHYKGLFDSVASTLVPQIEQMLTERISPFERYIGKQEVKMFSSAHKDYPKYERQVQEIFSSGRAKSLEDAYKLASWDDKMKGAGSAAVRSEQERKAKIIKSPIRRAPGASGEAKPKFKSFDDALRYNAKKLGFE